MSTKFFRIIVLVFLHITLSGCLYSEKPFFSNEDGIRIFEEQVGFFKKKSLFEKKDKVLLATPVVDSYALQLTGGSAEAIAVPLSGHADTYILQIGPWDNSYKYLLAKIEKGGFFSSKKFTELSFRKSDIEKTPKLSSLTVKTGFHYSVPSKEDLIKFYSYVLSNDLYQEIEHKIFDLSDANENTNFVRLVESTNSSADIDLSRDASTANSVRDRNFGIWRFKSEKDVISDKIKEFVFGFPDTYEGAQDKPYIRMGCYDDDMGITLYWGNVMRDMYPSGEANAVLVTVRIDQNEPFDLGWIPSDDFTATYPAGAYGGVLGFGEAIMGKLIPDRNVNFTWKAKELHQIMMRARKMVVRASNHGVGDTTIIFDMEGYTEIVQSNFRRHCQ